MRDAEGASGDGNVLFLNLGAGYLCKFIPFVNIYDIVYS